MRYSLVILLAFSLCLDAVAQDPVKTIPVFTFLRYNKAVFTNKDLATGKPVFFIFFDAECDHCRHAIEYLNQHRQQFSKAAIYLITLDEAGKLNSFISKYGNDLKQQKNITFLQDTQNEFITKFHPRKYPSLMLYNTKKTLLLYSDDEQQLPSFVKLIITNNKRH